MKNLIILSLLVVAGSAYAIAPPASPTPTPGRVIVNSGAGSVDVRALPFPGTSAGEPCNTVSVVDRNNQQILQFTPWANQPPPAPQYSCVFKSGVIGAEVPPSSSISTVFQTFTTLSSMTAFGANASNISGLIGKLPPGNVLAAKICCTCSLSVNMTKGKKAKAASLNQILHGDDAVVSCGGVPIPHS